MFSTSWDSVLVIPSLLFILFFLGKFVINKRKNATKNFPPGSRGWPIVGDSLNWYNAVASSHPPRFVEKQVKRYGKIFSCSIFGKWAVVSADPGFNQYVMRNEGKLVQSSYPKSFRDLVGRNGVITAQGDQQKKLHSIASNMMRFDKLNSHFLNDIQLIMIKTFASFSDDQIVSLQDVCRKIAINLMVNQLLGVSSEAEVNEMAQLFSDFVDGCLSVPINVPGFAFHTAMKAREKMVSIINKSVEATHRRQRHQQPEGGVDGNDNGGGFVGRLVEEKSLPDEAVADFIINLLFAGNETTAKTMLFAVYFLTRCPAAMKQLLEEQQSVRRLNGDEDMLTWEDYKAMPFTQCVIDETLRLGGIAIWLLREAKVDFEYQGYVIPKGWYVIPFLSAVHLDEKLYEGALTFNPWRWMEVENQKKRNWRNSQFYSPFGGGARFCPGAELARLQISMFLHYFVTSYRWAQIKEDRMSFFPSARLVNGFPIKLTKIHDRSKLD